MNVRLAVHAFPTPDPRDMATFAANVEQARRDHELLERWRRRSRLNQIKKLALRLGVAPIGLRLMDVE
jgi:hypothetical protein